MYSVKIDGAYLAEHSGDEVNAYGEDDWGRVSVVFPDQYGDEDAPKPRPTSPEAWCNAAGVEVTEDEVRVWISTGDPRGAFQMTAWRMEDGTIILGMPHPGESLPHEDTVEIRPGTLAVKRSIPEGVEV